MAVRVQDAVHEMGINEWCRLHKRKCGKCGQLFKANEGVTKMPILSVSGTEWEFYHYPVCPHVPYDIGYRQEVAPSSNALAPSLNYNVDEGWE